MLAPNPACTFTQPVAVILALLVPATVGAPAADGPQRSFDALFGAEAKRVRSTRETADDVAFAAKLVKSAETVADDAAFQALLLQRACEFAWVDAAGAKTLDAAAGLLATARPPLRDEADRQLLAGLARDYRAGPASRRKAMAPFYVARLLAAADARASDGDVDAALALCREATAVAKAAGPELREAVAAKSKELTARQVAAKKFAALKARLDKDPADARAATELVRLLLVEADQPDQCADYLDAVGDQELKAVAELASKAAKSPDSLREDEALRLADWYKAQAAAASAGSAARVAMSRRARACYEWFLSQHAAEDAQRLAAKLAMDELAPAAAAGTAAKTARHVDLLALVPRKKLPEGDEWTRDEEGGLVSRADGASKLRFPYQPPDEYDVRVEFTFIKGNEGIVLNLPQGDNRLSAMIYPNNFSFDRLDEIHWPNQPFTIRSPGMIQVGRRSELRIEVRKGSVAAFLNGKPLTRAKFAKARIGDGNLDTGEGGIGLVTWGVPAAFHVIEVAEFRAKGKPRVRGR
jgi:hypothetical protein